MPETIVRHYRRKGYGNGDGGVWPAMSPAEIEFAECLPTDNPVGRFGGAPRPVGTDWRMLKPMGIVPEIRIVRAMRSVHELDGKPEALLASAKLVHLIAAITRHFGDERAQAQLEAFCLDACVTEYIGNTVAEEVRES